MNHEDDIERFEEERELELYREYRDVLPMFSFVIETERRFYLANEVKLHERPDGWLEVVALPRAQILHAPPVGLAPGVSVPTAHAGSLLAARSLALRARGLDATSSSLGSCGWAPTVAIRGVLPQTHTGSSGGQVQPRRSRARKRLTMRSSSE